MRPGHSLPIGQGKQPAAREPLVPPRQPTQPFARARGRPSAADRGGGHSSGAQSEGRLGGLFVRGCEPAGQEKESTRHWEESVEPEEAVVAPGGQAVQAVDAFAPGSGL